VHELAERLSAIEAEVAELGERLELRGDPAHRAEVDT
jgi:hypothetical protein